MHYEVLSALTTGQLDSCLVVAFVIKNLCNFCQAETKKSDPYIDAMAYRKC